MTDRMPSKPSSNSISEVATEQTQLAAKHVAENILQRRTINHFLPELPPKKLIMQAISHARWAPNHRITEPWRFYLLGEESKAHIIELNTELVRLKKGAAAAELKRKRWSQIPGWLVVTCHNATDPIQDREDYAACACAIQNLQLYLWAQGVGVKWTTGPVTRDPRFYDLLWIDDSAETVAGLLWYGYPAEEAESVRKPLEKILIELP